MKKFIFLTIAVSVAFGFFRWGVDVRVQCGTNITTLTFGADSAATTGYDPYLDIPYFPTPGGGYGYFPLSDSLHPAYTMLSTDYRPPSSGEMIWDVYLQSGVNFNLKWSALPDSGEFSIGAFVLDSLPVLFVESWQDMRTADSISIMMIGGRIRAVGAPVSAVTETDLPCAARLYAYPNPFNSSVRLDAGAGSGEIEIFDLSGRLVEILEFEEGSVEWSPRANLGSGVYFALDSKAPRWPLTIVYLK